MAINCRGWVLWTYLANYVASDDIGKSKKSRIMREPAQRQITDLFIVGSFGEMPMTGRKEVVNRG